MLFLVRKIRDQGATPNFNLFGAMIYYIDAFPERFHHPKEDRYLFRLLRKRYPQASALLDQLEEQHRIGTHKVRTLEQALTRYQNGGDDECLAPRPGEPPNVERVTRRRQREE